MQDLHQLARTLQLREAIRLALDYSLDGLRYNKVTVFVHEFNAPPFRLHESLCFRKEGQLRQSVVSRGRSYDHFIYGLMAGEFRATFAGGAAESALAPGAF